MSSSLIRRSVVRGFENRVNEILSAIVSSTPTTTTVFFGGDTQDFEEQMRWNPQTRSHISWCLERVAEKLVHAFPNHNILIVRPFELHQGIYSRFSNFVESDIRGIPTFGSNYGSIRHLSLLLQSILNMENTTDLSVNLIGFSKGCVVLNQFIYEMTDSSHCPIKIEKMTWLDGGHGGSRNTWLTDRSILHSFALRYPNITIDVRVTPYQVWDSVRPWIGQEQETFVSILTSEGMNVDSRLYFEHDSSLEAHFQIIDTLKNEELWRQLI